MPPPCMEQHSLVFQQQKYLGEGGTLNVIFVTYMNKQLLWGIRFDLYFPPCAESSKIRLGRGTNY